VSDEMHVCRFGWAIEGGFGECGKRLSCSRNDLQPASEFVWPVALVCADRKVGWLLMAGLFRKKSNVNR
jgi:hypothetical protein